MCIRRNNFKGREVHAIASGITCQNSIIPHLRMRTHEKIWQGPLARPAAATIVPMRFAGSKGGFPWKLFLHNSSALDERLETALINKAYGGLRIDDMVDDHVSLVGGNL